MKKNVKQLDLLKGDILEFQERVKEKFPYNQYREINDAVGNLRYYYLDIEGRKYLSFEVEGAISGPIKGKVSANAKLGYVLGKYQQAFVFAVEQYMQKISYAEDLQSIVDELDEIINRYL